MRTDRAIFAGIDDPRHDLRRGRAAQAQQIVVITNPSITLSAGDLRDAYLGEKLLADGTPLVLLDNASVQDASSPRSSGSILRSTTQPGRKRHFARASRPRRLL